jgi:UDP-glucuronate 4-epimerase
MIYNYHHLYGIRAVCLRLFTVYGPRQRPEMAVSLFTDRIFRGREIRIFGDGSSRRDYTFIEDIIAGIMKCRTIGFDYEIFNLGRSDTVRLDELVRKIEICLGKKARIVTGDDQPGDVRQTFADISRAEQSFGYDPQTSIDEGLRAFIDWYMKERAGK